MLRHPRFSPVDAEEAYTKSTLKYLNIDNMEIRKTHMVWESAGYETMSVSKAMIKVKLLLGTYILQSNRHKFNTTSLY
jgi:hypothetical protein